MSKLHTINKSPFDKNSFDSCLTHAEDGSAVLLIEDGVYAAVAGGDVAAKIADASSRLKVYVLGPDLAARGMAEDRIADGVSVVDYGGFVDLAEAHDAVHSWL
jgi:tRNA 2-thiouridine synthesizing protein B